METTHLFEDSNAEAKEKILTHSCEACGHGFSSHQGLQTHETIWCGWADKLDKEKDWEVKAAIDAVYAPHTGSIWSDGRGMVTRTTHGYQNCGQRDAQRR